MIQTSDVFAAAKTLWDSSATLRDLVPGGLWEGPPAAPAAVPYASATITAGEPQWDSSAFYLHPFTLTLTVWSVVGATNAGRIQKVVQTIFRRRAKSQLRVTGAETKDLRPVPGEVTTEPVRHDAKDVKLTASRFEVLLLGTH